MVVRSYSTSLEINPRAAVFVIGNIPPAAWFWGLRRDHLPSGDFFPDVPVPQQPLDQTRRCWGWWLENVSATTATTRAWSVEFISGGPGRAATAAAAEKADFAAQSAITIPMNRICRVCCQGASDARQPKSPPPNDAAAAAGT